MPTTPPVPGRKPKPRRRFTRFGEFLQAAREKCAPSQQKTLKLLAQAGLKVSQSWVASLEVGGITDPDPAVLHKLEKAYGIDYDRIVYELIRDKYGLIDGTPLSRERWRVAAGLLQSFPAVGGVEGLEIDQLHAKARMLESELLDVEGLAKWQRGFPNLKELWIVSPHFQDDKNASLRDAVIHNLGRGVRHVYFVPKIDLEEGRPFWLFRNRLAQDHPALRKRVEKQIAGIGLDEAELRWIITDLILANPTDPTTRTGFVGLRHDRALAFTCRMSELDVESAVQNIMPFLAKRRF